MLNKMEYAIYFLQCFTELAAHVNVTMKVIRKITINRMIYVQGEPINHNDNLKRPRGIQAREEYAHAAHSPLSLRIGCEHDTIKRIKNDEGYRKGSQSSEEKA